MELPSKLLEQTIFNLGPTIEENMLIVMDKPTKEGILSQTLQKNIKQFTIAVTFLTSHNSIFIVTNRKNKFNFILVIERVEYKVFRTPRGVFEMEILKREIKRNVSMKDILQKRIMCLHSNQTAQHCVKL